MTALLILKQKIKEFYGEHDTWILPILKFILAFGLFKGINTTLGFMGKLDNIFVVLILALLCSVMPVNTMTILGCVLIIGHCYAVGIEVAGFALLLMILLMILFLRFTSKDNVALVLTPVSFAFHIPAGSRTHRLRSSPRTCKCGARRLRRYSVLLYASCKRQGRGTARKRDRGCPEASDLTGRTGEESGNVAGDHSVCNSHPAGVPDPPFLL